MRLALLPEELTRDELVKRARTTIQVATALASTARGAAPALLKEVPSLVGSVAGGAWGTGSALVRHVLGGEHDAPAIGEHQVSDVEEQRDEVLPPASAQPTPTEVIAETEENGAGNGAVEAAQVGAPGSAAEAVDKAAHRAAASADFVSGAVLSHDELPLPDFDHLTIGALRNKIRPLSLTQLVQLREWERAHADRLLVVTALDNRIAKLQADSADSGKPKTG